MGYRCLDSELMNYIYFDFDGGLKRKTKRAILNEFGDVEKIDWNWVESNRLPLGMGNEIIPSSYYRKDCLEKTIMLKKKLQDFACETTMTKNIFKEVMTDDLPQLLFLKGEKSILKEKAKVAIVGSRKPTSYGRKVAQLLTRFLVQRGVVVVSGLALGIDAIVHQTALNESGKSIAVLASGVTACYPQTNTTIYKKMLEKKHLILSEFFEYQSPRPYHFPLRNRLISAMSDLVVIIEAGEKSGTLTTAQHGLEQGKTIFSVPGSIFSSCSKGSNQLIYDGAIPLLRFEDILQHLDLNQENTQSAKGSRITAENGFSSGALKIYKMLTQVNTLTLETLQEELKIDYSKVLSCVSELVIEGVCFFDSVNEIKIN